MFSSIKRLVIGTAAVIGFASTANAAYVPATWTDSIGGSHYVGAGQTYSYRHDITDWGFNPATDYVTNFSLSIDLWDDSNRDGSEVAYIGISNVLGGLVFDITDDFNGWSLFGLAELNAFGTLSVTVTSVCLLLTCGDFVVGTSTLVANGYSQVPEPGTIALLGLGLLGVGLGRRKLAK